MRDPGVSQISGNSSEGASASWRAFLVIAIAGSVLYGRTFFFGYTYFDDDNFILKNIETLSKPSAIFSAFSDLYYSSYYRPILTVSFAIDAMIGGASPWIYHLSNVIYHIMASCLVFILALKLNLNRSIALPVSLLFEIHPLATSSVAWIVGRNETIFLILFLIAFISYLNFKESNRKVFMAVHLLAFLLAMLTKETALILPIVIVLHGRIILGKWKGSNLKSLWAGWLIVVTAWIIMREVASDGLGIRQEIFSPTSILPNLRVVLEAVGKLFVPLNLSPYPTFSNLTTYIGAVIIFVYLLYMMISRKKLERIQIFAVAWLIILLIPSLFLKIFDSENRFNYLEYRFYGPTVGFSILLGAHFRIHSEKYKRLAYVVLAFVLIAYAFLTIGYSSVYRDPISHWQRAVKMSPKSSDAYFNLAIVSMEIGKDPEAAADYYSKAINLNQSNPKYHYNLGLIYLQSGLADLARIQFEKTTQLDSTILLAQHNLANLYFLSGDLSAAEERWLRVLKLDSNFIYAKIRLSEIYRKRGKLEMGKEE